MVGALKCPGRRTVRQCRRVEVVIRAVSMRDPAECPGPGSATKTLAAGQWSAHGPSGRSGIEFMMPTASSPRPGSQIIQGHHGPLLPWLPPTRPSRLVLSCCATILPWRAGNPAVQCSRPARSGRPGRGQLASKALYLLPVNLSPPVDRECKEQVAGWSGRLPLRDRPGVLWTSKPTSSTAG
jgi:hypothetical protein